MSADDNAVVYAVNLAVIDIGAERCKDIDLANVEQATHQICFIIVGNIGYALYIGISEETAGIVLGIYTAQIVDNDPLGCVAVFVADNRCVQFTGKAACIKRKRIADSFNDKTKAVAFVVIRGVDLRLMDRGERCVENGDQFAL